MSGLEVSIKVSLLSRSPLVRLSCLRLSRGGALRMGAATGKPVTQAPAPTPPLGTLEDTVPWHVHLVPGGALPTPSPSPSLQVPAPSNTLHPPR